MISYILVLHNFLPHSKTAMVIKTCGRNSFGVIGTLKIGKTRTEIIFLYQDAYPGIVRE